MPRPDEIADGTLPSLARRARRGLVALALLVVAAGWCAGLASAHAELIRSSPFNGQLLESSPAEILLEFTEAVDPIVPGIRLVDGQGREMDIADVDQDRGGSTMRALVTDELADGTYVVAWQVVSADSHRIRGAFTFSVGEATATAPGLVDGLFDEQPDGTSDALLLGIGRFLGFAGIGVFVGLLGVASVLAAAVVTSLRGQIVLAGALGSATIGTVVMMATQAHLIGGSPLAWVDVIDTQSGRWWAARFLVLAALALVLVAWPHLGRARTAVVAAVGVGAMAVIAAGGHGVSGDSPTAGLVATILHLLAMSTWLGALSLIVLERRGERLAMAARVSPWALGSVVVLAVTGSINAWRQLDGLGSLTDSAYGRWLVVKLALVAVVVALAALNRWTVRRNAPSGDVVIGRSVSVELVGMALVLAATAGLVNSSPPQSAAEIASGSAVVGERIAQIELDPAVTGGTEMHVYITSPSGALDRAAEIAVSAELASAGIGPLDLETQPAGANHNIGTNVDLPIAGDWTFVVKARFGEFEQVTFTMQIPVTD